MKVPPLFPKLTDDAEKNKIILEENKQQWSKWKNETN